MQVLRAVEGATISGSTSVRQLVSNRECYLLRVMGQPPRDENVLSVIPVLRPHCRLHVDKGNSI